MRLWALLCILLVRLDETLGQGCGGDKGPPCPENHGNCSGLYSSCHRVNHTLAFLQKAVGFCPNVENNLQHIMAFMLNQSASLVPLIHNVCPDNHTFCPVALDNGFCIPKGASCSNAGAMRLLNGSTLDWKEGHIDQSPWLDRCSRSSNVWQCAFETLAAWVGVNDSMIGSFFNQSCPTDTRYCLAEGRCVPVQEKCYDVNFQGTCDPSHKFCYSKLGCIPKDEDCPSAISPLVLRMLAILKHPGEINNETFYFLFQTGWARFCFLNRVVRAVFSKTLRQCDARQVHCQREGYEGHKKCLEATSGCMNPMRELGVCTMVFNYCKGLEKDLPDFVKMLLPIMKKSFHIGWADLCAQGGAICKVLENELGTCPHSNVSGDACAVKDLPHCENNLRFCPRLNACKPPDECDCPDDKKACNGSCVEDWEPCEDRCSDEYSSCRDAREGIAFIEGAKGFCSEMQGNPDKFVRFLKNQTASWTPFEKTNCSEGNKFCPLALAFPERKGCIPIDANCTVADAIRPPNERKAGWAYQKIGDQTPWHDRCPEGSGYSAIIAKCVPDALQYSLQTLAAWVGKNNSLVTPSNESCPENTRFCLIEGRCIPVNMSCHDIDEAVNSPCNSSQRFCYSKFKCIPEGADCPLPRFPLGLKLAAIMEHPSDVKNETYRDLVKTGWAGFCLVSKTLHTVQFKAQSVCDAREDHCRREGYNDHQKCLEENSGCWNPLRGICSMGFDFCQGLMKELPEPLRMILQILSDQFNFPLSEICGMGKKACEVVESAFRMCKPADVSEDACSVRDPPLCQNKLRFCPAVNACIPREECDCGNDQNLCQDDCSRLYSSCHRVHQSVAFIEEVGSFCSGMLEDPEKFLRFLKNQTANWSPFVKKNCSQDQRFCPLAAFRGEGCISMNENCTGVFQGSNPEKKEMEENGEKDEKKTPWNDRCRGDLVYCDIFGECTSRGVCSLQYLSPFVGLSNSSMNLFNVSCPADTKFCLSQGRCLPMKETCHVIDLPYDLLMQLPGEVKNETKRILAETGWSRFCFLNQVLRAVYLKTQHYCDAREYHCQREGYGHHLKCLEEKSGCWNPIKEVCNLGFNICEDILNGLPEFVKMFLHMASEQLQMPLADICKQGKSVCELLDNSVGYCLPLEMSEDACSVRELPRCENNLRFCPRVNACKPLSECDCPKDQKPCQGNCSGLYSSCNRVRHTLGFIEEAGRFCPKLLENPDHFVSFLKNQSARWTPLLNNITCPKDNKFCPLALKTGGCIPNDANCSGPGDMLQGNGSKWKAGGEDKEKKGWSNTPWHDQCPENSEYCGIFSNCIPNGMCTIQHLAAWVGLNNSMVTPFNKTCGAGTRYCLTKGRCIPVNEKCHDVDEDLSNRCNSSDRFCYSNFRCVPKDEGCPPSKFPRGLFDAVIQNAGQATNATFRDLVQKGWAPFCFLNKELHTVYSKTQRKCDARDNHCRRDGYDDHLKCLEANSGCMNPVKEICSEGLKFCKGLRNETSELTGILQEIAAEILQTRLPDICEVGEHICTVLQKSLRICLPTSSSEDACSVTDLPLCQNNLRFCPRENACIAREACDCPSDDCSKLYSSCHHVHQSISIIEEAGSLCSKMVEDPKEFLTFLKNQNVSWTPLKNKICEKGYKFCPLALWNNTGCIPIDTNCTVADAMLPREDNDPEEKKEEKEEKDDDKDQRDGNETVWRHRCPGGFMYCGIVGQCLSDTRVCLLHHLTALIAMNNSNLNHLLNVSCPPGSRFCLGETRCIPLGAKCNLINIPYSLLMALPGQIRNETYRFIVETAGAPFCLVKEVLGELSSGARRNCMPREEHCRKEGYSGHLKCLEENSKCWNPIKSLGICPGLINFCEGTINDLPEFIKVFLHVASEQLQIRLPDVCGMVKSVCGLLENSLSTCHPSELPKDTCAVPPCEDHLMFCPEVQACIPRESCITSSISSTIRPTPSRTAPHPPSSSVAILPKLPVLFLRPGAQLKDMFKIKTPVLIGISVTKTPNGGWNSLNNKGEWENFASCANGEVLAMSTETRARFSPNGAFHGLVNFTIYTLTKAQPGNCVPAEGAPTAMALTIVFPDTSGIKVSLLQSTLYIDEDEESPGEKLSDIFNITKPDLRRPGLDQSYTMYIPKDILDDYQTLISNVDKLRPAVLNVKPMDPELGDLEFKSVFGWVTFPPKLGNKKPLTVDLDDTMRIYPRLNAHGITEATFSGAVWLPQTDVLKLDSAPPDARKIIDKIKSKASEDELSKMISLVVSLFGQDQVIIDRAAEEMSQHFSELRVSPREFREFIKGVHAMRIPVSKGDCNSVSLSKNCYLGKTIVTLTIVIRPVDDPPKVVDPDNNDYVIFPPVPYDMNIFPKEGISVAALTKTNNKLLSLLTENRFGEAALELMAKGEGLSSLRSKVPSNFVLSPEILKRLSRPLIIDENPAVGMAIYLNGNSSFGKWSYGVGGSWQDLHLYNTDKALERGERVKMLFLCPEARLKFNPKYNNTFWTKFEAEDAFLEFYGWSASGNCTSEEQVVDVLDIADTITNTSLYLIVDKLGCDKRPGSMAKADLCGVCNGRDKCVGCDRQPNSGAKYDKCGQCVGGKTGKNKTVIDCAGSCKNTSYRDDCGVCQARAHPRRVKDCNNVCRGKPGYGAKFSCGQCVGGNTGKSLNLGKDSCGECGGNNESCTDCRGVINGKYKNDSCNQCKDPKDNTFDACVKIKKVHPTYAQAKGGTDIFVGTTGLENSKVAKCWFEDDKNGKQNQEEVNIAQNKFRFKLKQIPPGKYSLKCSFDDDSTKYEYEKEKLCFFGDDTKISSASPNETEISKAVNVTLNGTGFVNTDALVCILSVSGGKSMKFPAEFRSSAEIMCYLNPIKISGSYELGVSFSGEANADLVVEFPVYTIAPEPDKCQFSNNLRYVTCSLDKRAQLKGGCGNFLKSLVKFGNSPQCIVRDLQLRIFLFGRFSLKVGDKITFRLKSFLRKNAKLTKHTGQDEKELAVERPEKSDPLEVELSGSTEVGSCESFRLRARGNKKGLRYEWYADFCSVAGKTNDSEADLEQLNKKLLNETKKSIQITDSYVIPGICYRIHVRVYNDILNETAEDYLEINRVGKAIPLLYFSEKNYTIKASVKLKLRGIIELSRCQKLAKYDVQFLWEYPPGLEVFQKSTRLNIKGGWRPGQLHKFTLKVTMADDKSLTTSASVDVYVEEEPLQACVKGGIFLTVGEEELFTLDGRCSYDPNDSPEIEQYSWDCIELETGLPSGFANSSNFDIFERLVLPDEGVVEFSAGLLEPEILHKCTLTYRKGEKVSNEVVFRMVVPGKPPVLFLRVKENVNPSDKVVITAAVQTTLDFTMLVWSCRLMDEEGYGYVDLSDPGVLLSNKAKAVIKDKGDVVKSRSKLVFNRNALDGGVAYRIVVEAFDLKGDVKSSAYVDIKPNAPPSQGIATVEPENGEALSTAFKLCATDVFDDPDDEPLNFRCGCKIRKRDKVVVQYTGPSTESECCEFVLPPGDKNNNFTHDCCFIEVADVHQAASRSECVSITVKERVLDENAVKNGTDDIERQFGAGKTSEAASLAVAILKTFSEVVDDNVRAVVEKLQETVTENLLKSLESRDPDDKESFISSMEAFSQCSDRLTYFNEDLAKRLFERLRNLLKPLLVDSGQGSKRRRRDAGQQEIIEAKTAEEVETILDTFSNLITPDDYRNSSMTQKEQFISTVDELGRSLCKGMSGGEPAQVAQSKVGVLRSEQNLFEAVDKNYTNIACDECEVGVNTSAQVLLGQSLKEQYQNWQCSDQACSGACIVSAQYPDDLLLDSENKDRISDVIYVKLFNPDTLSVLEVSGLGHPVSYKVPLKSYNASKGEPKCHAWNSASSNWSTSGVLTGEISTEGATSFINCSKNELGHVAVFLVEVQVVPTTATTPNVTPDVTTNVKSNATTAPVVQDQPAFVQFSLNVSYDEYINESTKSDFIKQTKKSIATNLKVNESRVTDLTVAPGSIIVTFKLLPGGSGDKNTSSLVSLLKSQVNSGSFVITLSDGRNLTVDANSFVHLGATLPTTVPPITVQTTATSDTTIGPKPTSGSSGLSGSTLIVIIVVSCVVVIIVVVIVVVCVRKKKRETKIEAEDGEPVELRERRKEVGRINDTVRQEATHKPNIPGTPGSYHSDRQ